MKSKKEIKEQERTRILKIIDENICPYDCNDQECRVLRRIKEKING